MRVGKGTRIYVRNRVIGAVVAVDPHAAFVLWRNGSTELDRIPLDEVHEMFALENSFSQWLDTQRTTR